jgi:hypothetical protein
MWWQENVEQTLTGKKNCIRCIAESVSPTRKEKIIANSVPKRSRMPNIPLFIIFYIGLFTRGVLLNFYFAATNNTNGSNY